MAETTKIDEVRIPIFDGIEYSSWKFRLMMILEYKECKNPAIRQKLSSEAQEDWNKIDLKARTIIVSAVSNKQLEYLKECGTALQMIQKFDSLYSNQSTTLQIIQRNKLDSIKLKDFENKEEFFVSFERFCNELKKAGGNLSEEEKMRYMIKSLPLDYAYIGDFIDLVPKEQRNIDLIKNKILEKSMCLSEDDNKSNASTFNVRTNKECYKCGKKGHLIKECWHDHPQQSQSSRGQRGSNRGSRGRGHNTRERGRGQAASNEQQRGSSHQSWASEVKQVKVNLCSESASKNTIEWLLDSGCTDHIVNDQRYLSNIINLRDPIDVILPNNKSLKATKKGSVNTTFHAYNNTTNIELKNVYLVEGMKRNLLSLSKITEKNKIVAMGDKVKIYDVNNVITAIAYKRDGLYHMESDISSKT